MVQITESEFESHTAELERLRAEHDTLRSCYGNLLARIFRDGGQHYHDIGDDRAALAEANEVVASMMGAADELARTEAAAAAARETLATRERQLSLACAAFGRGGRDDIGIYLVTDDGGRVVDVVQRKVRSGTDPYVKPAELVPIHTDAGAKLLGRLAIAEAVCGGDGLADRGQD